MSIYDLRFTPSFISMPSIPKCNGPLTSLTKPYMTIAGAYAVNRFGLGFDYDPALGLIATGTSLCWTPPEPHTANFELLRC